ncbi:MAG TPA: KUP/HAK/KT family potassium transporter [Opitutaceae bacterium]|nr:KUP/HAK/KT family potassium transporter [Opitutaceae bacterium]
MSETHPRPPAGIQFALCLGALGIVFGDIGTSPLYAMQECLAQLPAVNRTEGVLGILSLIFWTLMFVVNFKYLTFVTRADNRGEGGIFALLALTLKRGEVGTRRGLSMATFIILAGAALLYGDGVITPAITVLSAAEGFKEFSPEFSHFVVPIAVGILAVLFVAQSRGTHAIARVFGPIMLIWFVVLGTLGILHISEAPIVFKALNPLFGINFLIDHPHRAALLGGIVLTITGAEALYADMGHFGRRYITRAWTFVVAPGLILNYFGQGAHAISHPQDPMNPFYALAPEGTPRLMLVGISIVAAIIASQSLITGTFSLTRQAIQLGYFPRLRIFHTSAHSEGTIYVPIVNWALAIGAIWIVLEFRSSLNLAAAYGIAVTGTMAVTTFAFFNVIRSLWRWAIWKAVVLCAAFIVVDITFFAANFHKFTEGGWLPIAIAVCVLAVMHTWKSGRNEIQEKVYGGAITELELSSIAKSKSITRVPGSAVFMVGTPKGTPLALLHHLKANKCLQQTVVLLTIATSEVPVVDDDDRLRVEELGEGVWRAIGHYGYMESPDVSSLIDRVQVRGVPINPAATTYFFNREMIITGGNARMWDWQKRLYAFLSRNATPVKDYYQILPTQIIEIGLPVQL